MVLKLAKYVPKYQKIISCYNVRVDNKLTFYSEYTKYYSVQASDFCVQIIGSEVRASYFGVDLWQRGSGSIGRIWNKTEF